MRVVFASNYYNHHQKMISYSIDKLTDHEYTFLATSEMREERKKLGYGEKIIPSFVTHSNNQNLEQVQDLITNSDVVIVGSVTSQILDCINRNSRITFRYSERILKQKISFIRFIFRWIKLRKSYPKKSEKYLLCAGAYTAGDYVRFGLYKDRMYKWGYFPETIKYENLDEIFNQKDKTQLLWCGRFLDWKHPDDAIRVAKRLKDDGYSFNLNIIGSGELERYLSQLVEEYSIKDCVSILGPMQPQQVRNYMENAGIYLFTSDRQEGWGAVLNEAMNSGCAVVASNVAGATPYLISNGSNGFIYESGNLDSLYQNVKLLLDNYEKQEQVGKAAYQTIVSEWNAEVAADRFLNLAKKILEGELNPDLYETGPCSKAITMSE